MFASSGLKAPTNTLIGPHTIKVCEIMSVAGFGDQKNAKLATGFRSLNYKWDRAIKDAHCLEFPIRNPLQALLRHAVQYSVSTNLATVQLPPTPPESTQISRTHSYVNSESDIAKA